MLKQNSGILEALAINEEKVGKLYETYAGIYAEYYNFWLMLSEDELSHASWLRSLNESYKKGLLAVNEKKFDLAAVKLFGDYLEQRVIESQNNELPMEKALAIAMDIENSLIEKNWFTMFDSAFSEDRFTLDRLIKALGVHKIRVSEMISEYVKK